MGAPVQSQAVSHKCIVGHHKYRDNKLGFQQTDPILQVSGWIVWSQAESEAHSPVDVKSTKKASTLA